MCESLAHGGSSSSSVTCLSLNPIFQRTYGAITKVIKGLRSREETNWETKLWRCLSELNCSPFFEKYIVLGSDVTAIGKPQSRCHPDRKFVYTPSPGSHRKPIVIGHSCSCLAQMSPEGNWLMPLSMRRVKSTQTDGQVGMMQLGAALKDPNLGFSTQRCIHLGDSSYSNVDYLYASHDYEELIQIVRLRGNRGLYEPFAPTPDGHRRGRPKHYGKKFNLGKEENWPEANDSDRWQLIDRKGQIQWVEAFEWQSILMQGKRDKPMWDKPFRLVRFRLLDQEGKPKLKRTLWLAVAGKHRAELDLKQIFKLYSKRFDIEHFFRFAKQKLMLKAFQTPDRDHLENWWQFVLMAWNLLYAARYLAQAMPNPWEKYLPYFKQIEQESELSPKTPAVVQKDYFRIIQGFEPITPPPKPLKNGKGRKRGTKMTKRKTYQVIKKGKKKKKVA